MSLFKEQHHDQLLLSYLDIDSIRELSQVNKYYYKLTRHILQSFIEFFTSKYSLMIKLHDYIFNAALRIDSKVEVEFQKLYIFAQAVMHGDYSVVHYIYNKYNLHNLDMRTFLVANCDNHEVLPFKTYRMHIVHIIMLICFQKKVDFKLVAFIADIYIKWRSSCYQYIDIKNLTSDYGDEYDKVRDFLSGCNIIKN